MKIFSWSITRELGQQCAKAALTVAVTTALLILIGRAALGEAVIALVYLVPVGWSASRWGPGAGLAAAVTAALCFDFFFIPPFYTFTVGSLEGWLVLAIFLAVATLGVGRIQAGFARAQASEREAIFMYELSASLAGLRTQSTVAQAVARQLQEMYQALQVTIVLWREAPMSSEVVREPPTGAAAGQPDRVVPILTAAGLVGEIHLWRGQSELPAEDSRLLRNFASQAGQALERTRLAEAETRQKAVEPRATHVN